MPNSNGRRLSASNIGMSLTSTLRAAAGVIHPSNCWLINFFAQALKCMAYALDGDPAKPSLASFGNVHFDQRR